MKKVGLRLGKLFSGLFLCSLGIVMTIRANLGLAPWDVFHQGLSNLTGITIGQASIIVGIVLIIINSILGERLGWGTVCNMLFIGLFIDILLINNIIITFKSIYLNIFMMLLGMFILGIGCYFYIGAGLGSGPRDGLMVFLTKRTNKSVRFIRNTIEISALILGYFLGGTIGIGTLITAAGIGYFVQLAFKVTRFNISEVQHRFIDEDIAWIRKLIAKGKSTDNANQTIS